jgi:predicted amidohydrolase YtcJ
VTESLIFTGGTVLTMTREPAAVEAVGVGADGRIAAVGPEAEVRAALGAPLATVDLDGGALLPGFIDAHHHYSLAAFDRRMPDLHLPPGSSIEDLLALVEKAAAAQPGRWVRAQGYDPSKLVERRPPRSEELDQVCPDRPTLVVAYSFHEGCLNSMALAELGWDERSPDPQNGILVRDRRGRLTGEVAEQAFFVAEALSRESLLPGTEDAWIAECEAHGRELLRAGIVRVGDAAVAPPFERLYERAAAAGKLPVIVHRMPVGGTSIIEPRYADEPTGSGPQETPVGPAKLFMDGGERCAVCMRKREFFQAAGAMVRGAIGGAGLAAIRAVIDAGAMRLGKDALLHRGMLFWDQQRLDRTVGAAAGHGLQVAQHAVGNEAISVALTAIERNARGLEAVPGRPRLEHVFFVDSELVRRIAASPAIAVVQPHFVYEYGDRMRVFPLWRDVGLHAYRRLLQGGVELAGSSDYPVSGYDVLAAVRAAVTRRTELGELFAEEQAIEVEEALRAYTVGGARALGVEDEAGTIEPGKRADLTVVSADPTAMDPDSLGEIEVMRTYVGGRLAFDTGGTDIPV